MTSSYYAQQARLFSALAVKAMKMGSPNSAKAFRNDRDNFMAAARRYQGV